MASLAALNRIVKHASAIFDTRSDEVMAVGIKLLTTASDEEASSLSLSDLPA